MCMTDLVSTLQVQTGIKLQWTLAMGTHNSLFCSYTFITTRLFGVEGIILIACSRSLGVTPNQRKEKPYRSGHQRNEDRSRVHCDRITTQCSAARIAEKRWHTWEAELQQGGTRTASRSKSRNCICKDGVVLSWHDFPDILAWCTASKFDFSRIYVTVSRFACASGCTLSPM